MKKIVLLLVCVMTLVPLSHIWAQCTPNPAIGQAYMYPGKLAPAMAGYYYTQVITFRVPKDTFVVYQSLTVPAVVDSAKVIHISGIPSGYSMECNNPRCTWPGGGMGCATFMGFSDSAGSMVGEYPIRIYVGTWARAANTTFYRIDSATNYVFRVLAYSGAFEINTYEPLKANPNPTKDFITVELRDLNASENLLAVFDMTGKRVFEKTITRPDRFLSTEQVSLEGLPNGLYTVVLQSGTSSKHIKVLKN